jgi:hypothetical protein
VEGANSSELASKVAKYNETKQEEGEKAAQPKLDLNTKLSKLINTAPGEFLVCFKSSCSNKIWSSLEAISIL